MAGTLHLTLHVGVPVGSSGSETKSVSRLLITKHFQLRLAIDYGKRKRVQAYITSTYRRQFPKHE